MLRYFLRVAPDYGATQVSAALNARKMTGCFRFLLQELGAELPKVEQAAIGAPGDSDPELSQDAIRALSRWGSVDAEKASGRDWSGFIRSGPAAKPNSAPHRPARVRVRAALPWNRP